MPGKLTLIIGTVGTVVLCYFAIATYNPGTTNSFISSFTMIPWFIAIVPLWIVLIVIYIRTNPEALKSVTKTAIPASKPQSESKPQSLPLAPTRTASVPQPGPSAPARAVPTKSPQEESVISRKSSLVLGNYQLIRLLGEGGFAEVYLGEHIHLGTQTAIKLLHTQITSDDVDKFRDEARMIARLIHPNIVRVFDFGVENKTPYLVMDYAPHGTLRHRHPKGTQLALSTIVSYVKQLADALQYAHDEKLIHRDVKPENMLVGRRNEVLLSDFGIALIAQSSRYQSTQDMAGTIAYMAPEQIQAHPRPASDQYSLGIVVYEWLTGDRPFHGTFTEIAIKHSVAPPPSLRQKVPSILPTVEQVVLKALAKEPKARFGSVQEFATALEQAAL